MKYQEFGETYRSNIRSSTVAYAGSDSHFDMELVRDFSIARTWNERLGNIVLNHLNNGVKDPVFESDVIDEYVEWASDWAPRALTQVIERVERHGASPRYITELTFHLAAPAFGPQWHALSDESSEVAWEVNRATETSLALNSATTMKLRRELKEKKDTLPEAEREIAERIRREFVGQGTEFDTHLATVEGTILLPHRRRIAVPAPRQFEQSNRRLNVDTLVFEPDTREVYGIQAKTRITDRDFQRVYDSRFVTLIEGSGDLGNKVIQTMHERTIAVPEPGMLSLRHIERTPSRYIPLSPSFSSKDREELKQIAHELTRGSHYTVPRAGRIINERLEMLEQRLAVSQR